MPRKKNNYTVLIVAAVILIFIGFAVANRQSSSLNQDMSYLDEFAQCLSNEGAIFYGTFWCNHCEDQKRAFGSAFQYINYVECSTADGRGQLPACQQANIEAYPTWVFSDSSRQTGNLPLSILADKTACSLPQL